MKLCSVAARGYANWKQRQKQKKKMKWEQTKQQQGQGQVHLLKRLSLKIQGPQSFMLNTWLSTFKEMSSNSWK